MTMTEPITDDLNRVISAAVNARVETAVMEALSGDQTIGKMVVAALQQHVEVPTGNGYGKARVPFLNHLLQTTIRKAAEAAVAKVLVDEATLIEEEVRKHLKRQAPEIAATLAGNLVDAASKSYGVNVTLRMPGQ